MIYSKLFVVLLSAIAGEKDGSTNSTIARTILDNLESVKNMGIKDLANMCHVGSASISRFCKEIGLDGFAELKELIAESDDHRKIQTAKYIDNVLESVTNCNKNINVHKIDDLCKDIMKYEKISSFGLMKAESAAFCLQADLATLDIPVYTNILFSEQTSHIDAASEDELIIIFSYTGTYFDSYSSRLVLDKRNHPKIWMICGNQDHIPSFVKNTICFSSDGSLDGHPYSLLFAEGLIFRRLKDLFPDSGNK